MCTNVYFLIKEEEIGSKTMWIYDELQVLFFYQLRKVVLCLECLGLVTFVGMARKGEIQRS